MNGPCRAQWWVDFYNIWKCVLIIFSCNWLIVCFVMQEYIFKCFGAGFFRGVDYSKVYISDTDWIVVLGLLTKMGPIANLSREQWKILHKSGLEVSTMIYFLVF